MRRIAIPLIFALSALTSSIFASGSLDDVAKGMLGEPSVQVALKVTPRQRAKADARLLGTLFRSGLQAARAAAKEEQASLKLEFKDISRIEPADLTEDQRRRARQIALQVHVLDSLLTSDLTLALDLTTHQTSRLQKIQNERNYAYTKLIPAKRFEAFKKKYADLSKGAEGEATELADMSDEQFQRMMKATEAMAFEMSDLFAEMRERYAPKEAAANERAFRVLTGAQRARLRQLQGARFHSHS